MKAAAREHASVTLDERGVCDLELLAVGGYSPLEGFLGRADYGRVIREQKLADGTFWPLPVVLPVTPGGDVAEGKILALRDVFGNLLAFLHVDEIYPADMTAEARLSEETSNQGPPAPAPIESAPVHYAAGRLEVLRTPPHYDFVDLRHSPTELRTSFASRGWSRIVAFQTREPMHRADEELARRAAEQVGGGLLIHPSVGLVRPGDTEHYTRVRCYRALVDEAFGSSEAILSLLPYASRGSGPRELLLHAIIRRNYGCTHLLVGSEEADAGRRPDALYHATREVRTIAREEIGVEMVDLPPMVYLPEEARYAPVDEVPAGAKVARLSAQQACDDYLAAGLPLPEWFSRPAVAAILAEAHPPRFRQGLTIWFTGLSGSGKSTVALGLIERLAEYGRNCSMLDGDEIRTHLSKGLGFSKEDRDVNIRRVAYVAGLVARHGGTTLCSVVSPYKAVRDEARQLSRGNFVEVYCATPVEVCESRDVKGFYAKARAAMAEGKGIGFTGVDDPYEAPDNAEVTLDTSRLDVPACVDAIIAKLLELGYILPHGHIKD